MTTALGYGLVLSIGTGTALAALRQPPVARRVTTALGYALVLRIGTGLALSFSSTSRAPAGVVDREQGLASAREGIAGSPVQHMSENRIFDDRERQDAVTDHIDSSGSASSS